MKTGGGGGRMKTLAGMLRKKDQQISLVVEWDGIGWNTDGERDRDDKGWMSKTQNACNNLCFYGWVDGWMDGFLRDYWILGVTLTRPVYFDVK